MNTTTYPTSTWRQARLALLAAGPFLTLALLGRAAGAAYGGEWPIIVAVTALAWSPLFFSVPALLLQNERDAFEPRVTGLFGSLWRAVRLLPYLALSNRSAVRLEVAVSILAWGVFLRVHADEVAVGLSRLF